MKKRLDFQSSCLIRHTVFPSSTVFELKYYFDVAENQFINWLQMKVEKTLIVQFFVFFPVKFSSFTCWSFLCPLEGIKIQQTGYLCQEKQGKRSEQRKCLSAFTNSTGTYSGRCTCHGHLFNLINDYIEYYIQEWLMPLISIMIHNSA